MRLRRRSKLLLAVVVLVALGGLLAWRQSRPHGDLRRYSPVGYVEHANDLIRRGLLDYSCETGHITFVTPPAAQQDEAWRREKEWYEASFLASDVRRYNEDPGAFGWYFDVEGCQLRRVNPHLHAFSLPFSGRERWLGTIYYSGRESLARLESERVLAVLPSTEPARAATARQVTVASPESAQGSSLLLDFGDPSHPAARIEPVADTVAVLSHAGEAGMNAELRVGGRRAPTNRRFWLKTGDWLHLARLGGASETFVYLGGTAREVASDVRRRNDRLERHSQDDHLGWTSDPHGQAPAPFVASVAESVSEALAHLPREAARRLARDLDFELTLERSLAGDLGEAFRQAARRRGTGPHVAGGLTVMDTRSGRILALATHPWPGDVSSMDDADAGMRRRLLLNQNFRRHPIGSAGKPFFLAAIASAEPLFLDLVLDGHGPVERHGDVLQFRVAPGYQLLGGHGQPVRFVDAIERSCNKYAVELAVLGIADREPSLAGRPATRPQDLLPRDAGIQWPRPGTTSGIRIGTWRLPHAPLFSTHVTGCDPLRLPPDSSAACRCRSLERLEELPWLPLLRRLTGTAVVTEAPGDVRVEGGTLFYESYRSTRYDLRPWRRLLAELVRPLEDDDGEGHWKVTSAFHDVSPERVGLSFESLNDLRQDYVTLALGGGTSTWTNVQLAEAFTRLTTGLEVEATLVGEVTLGEEEDPGAAPLPPRRIPFDHRVREALLEGLARVVEGGSGTATALRGRLQETRRAYPEDDVFLLSKTGSPVLLRQVATGVSTALQGLVEGGHLTWDPIADDFRHEGGTLESALRTSGQRTAAGLRTGLNAVFDDFRDRRRHLSWPTPGDVPATVDGPLYLVGGALRLNTDDELFRRRLVRGRGSVYVFTLLRCPRAPDRPGRFGPTPEQVDDARTTGITVALHLTVGPDSAQAVAVARELLPRLIPLLAVDSEGESTAP